MKVVTPEIAWHETLPIYACDLQPLPSFVRSRDKSRQPLTEIPIPAASNNSHDCKKPTGVKECGEDVDPVSSGAWTRLATAGGDSTVRLWRVDLDWSPPACVRFAKPDNPLSKGMLAGPSDRPSTAAMGKKGKKEEGKPKVAVAVSEGLVFLSTLKRHERLVNVARWSPSGECLVFSY